jgi:transposase-like protein
MVALAELLESERTEVCGTRHARQKGREAYRAGHTRGELVMGGRRLSADRPRARTVTGEEVELPSWRFFSEEDPLTERAMEQMLVGVSKRNYARSLEPVSPRVKTRGTSKSAVSRRFVAKTEEQMEEWLKRDLSQISLAALMIDGVHVDEHVLLVALGIDVDGNKHVLGVREGATENSTACTERLADLVERNLRTHYTILAVLDGAKALAKAVRTVWGKRVLIQRCQMHELRNVADQLPESMRPSVKKAMQQAYRARNAKTAKRLLTNLLQRLRGEHPGAGTLARRGARRDAHGDGLQSAGMARAHALDDEGDREPDRLGPQSRTPRASLARRDDDSALGDYGADRSLEAIPQAARLRRHGQARGRPPRSRCGARWRR